MKKKKNTTAGRKGATKPPTFAERMERITDFSTNGIKDIKYVPKKNNK